MNNLVVQTVALGALMALVSASHQQQNKAPTPQEPPSCIVLNQDSNGLELTSPADGVDFDLNSDGKRERIGWTQPSRKDGFLVIDTNKDGIINDGSELVGSGFKDRRLSRTMNGFDALLFLQGAVLGPDGQPKLAGDPRLDSSDAVFRELLVWFDLNHNGRSERDELWTLEKASISAFVVGYRRAPDTTAGQKYAPYAGVKSINGNIVRFYGRYTIQSAGVELTRAAFEVRLLAR